MSGLSWLESFVELDFDSIQDQIAKSVEEASKLIEEVNSLEILNLDQLAIAQEEEEKRELEEEEEENNEEISHNASIPYDHYESTQVVFDDVQEDEMLDNSNLNEKNISMVPISQKVRKLAADNDSWSAEFTPLRPPLDDQSVKDTPLPSENLFPGDDIESHSASNDLLESSAHQSTLTPITGKESNSRSFSSPTKSMILPKPKPNEQRAISKPNVSEAEVKPKKKKKKKKKHDKSGLDFWGFSSTDESNEIYQSLLPTSTAEYSTQSTVALDMGVSVESVVEVAQKLPHRIVTGLLGSSVGNLAGYSFFDRVDDEVDLESDPILRSVQENISRPKRSTSSQFTASPFIASISESLNQWNMSSETSGVDSAQSSSTVVTAESSASQTLINIIYYLRIQATRIITFISSFLQTSANVIASGSWRSVWQELLDPETRSSAANRLCVIAWEGVSSVNGLATLTALLLIYSYFKFRRFGTDAGD